MTPPMPYTARLRRSNVAAPMGRYFTPFNASGIRKMMIRALKITADRMADAGLASCITFNAASCG